LQKNRLAAAGKIKLLDCSVRAEFHRQGDNDAGRSTDDGPGYDDDQNFETRDPARGRLKEAKNIGVAFGAHGFMHVKRCNILVHPRSSSDEATNQGSTAGHGDHPTRQAVPSE
jgi:hypothetical protein